MSAAELRPCPWNGASLGEEAVLADSGREGEITARAGRVRRLGFSIILRDTLMYVPHFALRGHHPHAKMRRVSSKILKNPAAPMERDARDMQERCDPRFGGQGSKFRKPRTSDLALLSISIIPPVAHVLLVSLTIHERRTKTE